MGCHLKATARLFIILHLLIGDVLPMEDYMVLESETSDLPMPDSTSMDMFSTTVVPTPSSAAPPTTELPTTSVPTTSVPITLTPEPSPTVPSDRAFFNYHNKSLYLFIQNIRIDITKHGNTYSIFGSELNSMDTVTVMPTVVSLIRSYFLQGRKKFELTFYFESSGEEEWELESFQHQNFSETSWPLYQYTGPAFSIRSLMGQGFNCTTIEYIGTAQVEEGTFHSQTKFMGLSVQPFLVDGKISSDFDSCDSAAVMDDGVPVEVIVGVTVCVCVVVAAGIVTTLAVCIKKYEKRRHYDLLKD